MEGSIATKYDSKINQKGALSYQKPVLLQKCFRCPDGFPTSTVISYEEPTALGIVINNAKTNKFTGCIKLNMLARQLTQATNKNVDKHSRTSNGCKCYDMTRS